MILYIQHIPIEGPESLGRFFGSQGFASRTICMTPDAVLPESFEGVEAVISLGGPMNVYEEDTYPFLRRETLFIQEVLRRDIPFLGICLGAQMLAKAADARVVRSPREEIGMGDVVLTKSGQADPLFADMPLKGGRLQVFQWHGDMFEIPREGVLLASADGCPHQAFRVGRRAYGLQFHVEIEKRNIREWASAYWDIGQSAAEARCRAMETAFEQVQETFEQAAQSLYSNFLNILHTTHR